MSLEAAENWHALRGRRYFYQFLRAHSPELNWDFKHLQYIQNELELALERAIAGKNQRIMIFCPPRHGKSEMCTIRFPAYCLHKRPYWKVIVGANNDKKATDFTRKMRTICKLAKMNLSEEKGAAGEWETLQGGGAISAGMQTGVPGRGANILILDDPVRNRSEANSKLISDKILDEFHDSFMTRLHQPNIVIIILTRWSELDLAGRLLEDEKENWKVISMPALAEKNDILGRGLDEPLCPELIPLEHMLHFKNNRPTTFESLYQQNPSIASGNIFKREWFNYFDDKPEETTRTILSVDTAFKEKTSSDYSVIGSWFDTPTGGYLNDVVREKMIYPKLKSWLISIAERDNPDLIMIEDKASGQSLIQDLQNSTMLPIVPCQADISKTSRAHATTGQFESGNIFFKANASWLPEFEHELLAFPNGAYDDQVDMVTQYINSIMKPVNDFIIV